ncbi:hypothetical protein D3C73_862700 [compost metagenome]
MAILRTQIPICKKNVDIKIACTNRLFSSEDPEADGLAVMVFFLSFTVLYLKYGCISSESYLKFQMLKRIARTKVCSVPRPILLLVPMTSCLELAYADDFYRREGGCLI